MEAHIVLLPGDGIGPEVISETEQTLRKLGELYDHDFLFDERLIGGVAIDETGTALPDETLAACRTAEAVLLGAVGGPKWDDPRASVRPEQGLLGLRKGLELFANLRPVSIHPDLASASPLKPARLEGVDFVVVRELTGGLYFGEPRKREQRGQVVVAIDTLSYSDEEIRRVMRKAFSIARQRRKLVTSVDKANVLESSRLWRQVANQVATEFPDVRLEHQLVDSAAMRLITHAASFDVLVTENMFGDILTDEASVLTGSIGMLPSASLGAGSLGLYEPIHGSAPDIAGQGLANPAGTILSSALMLRHSLSLLPEAAALEKAVHEAVAAGARTRDLGGEYSTQRMGEAIRDRI